MINGRSSERQSGKTYIGIVGGRDFTDKRYFFEQILRFVPLEPDDKVRDVVVVSGGAAGTDTLAEQFAAKFYHDEPWIYEPEQRIIEDRGFAAAAHARNREIVAASDFIVAFWDGKSKGTESTVNYARQACKPVVIIWI